MTARSGILASGLALLAAVTLLVAARSGDPAPWTLTAPAPAEDGRPAELEGWKEVSCVRCHARIAAEWASSRHASAWVGARYQESLLEKSRPESCHGCHAPDPLFLADAEGTPPQKPKPRNLDPKSGAQRDLDAHFGITCATCHLGRDGAMMGPFGATTDAHASKQHALFTSASKSELCIACHATTVGPVIGLAKDFADTDQAAQGRSCIGCHMQPIERPIAEQDGQGPFAARAGRSHALQTPRDPSFLKRAFSIRAEQREDGVVVTVENACGHRVPGLIGREITLAFELVDASGATVAHASIEFDARSSLRVDAPAEVTLAGRGVRVKLRGLHDAPGFSAKALFLDTTIDVGK